MNDLHRRIDDLAALALGHDKSAAELDLAASVYAYVNQELTAHGSKLDKEKLGQVLDLDIDLIVQGLQVWVSRQRESE
jgi:hypothetical protein